MLHELVQNATSAYGMNTLLGTSDEDTTGGRRFEWTTYGKFGRDIALVRSILCNQLGVMPLLRLGITSNNQCKWAAITKAAYSLSTAPVPMYKAQLPKDRGHALIDLGCKLLSCSSEDMYLRVRKEALPNAPRTMTTGSRGHPWTTLPI